MLRCALAFSWVLGLTPLASAQDASPIPHEPTPAELSEARRSFELAARAYDAADYATAVSEFRAALELSNAPELLFNIYLAEERLGHQPEAADALEQYLALATMDAEQRPLLEGRLSRLRARIAAREIAAAPEATDVLLASPIAPSTDTAPDDGAPSDPAPVAPPPSSSPPAVAIGLLVAAGLVAINFGVFAGLSFAEDGRLTSACGRGCSSNDVASLNTYDIVADVSWITAAVVGVTGLVLLFALPPDRGDEAPRVALAPWGGPTGAGLTLGGAL